MLTKLLFTAIVIAGVVVLYRLRTRTLPRSQQSAPAVDNRFGRMVSYGFVGFLITISVIFYYFHWRSENQVVAVRVIGGSAGNTTTYQAYRRSVDGKRFQTIDGRTVILGATERLEVLDAQ